MELGNSEHLAIEVIAEDIGVLVLRRRDALLFLQLVHGHKLIAVTRGQLKLLAHSGICHALADARFQLIFLAVQKELHVPDRFPVSVGCDQVFDARAHAALDVELQAGPRMVAVQVDLAAWDQKRAMDQVDDAVRKVAGKVRTEVLAAILAQLARHEHLRVPVAHRQLHVRVGFVIAQENVEARLALLDQVVLKRERLVLVGNLDVIHIDGLAHQRARL